MRLDLDKLPCDTALLHRLVRDMAGLVEHRDGEVSRLQQIIKQLQRAQFGRRSERFDPGQLVLGLKDLDADIAGIVESRPAPLVIDPGPARRKPLPEHLERKERLFDVEGEDCARYGGTVQPIGESVSEMLDWIPATLRVIRIRRPKYACRQCETVMQAPAPERVIAGGLAACSAHTLAA
jgi:transposase